ncbi:MCE family protein [Actinomadura sp. 7K507]|uniref:MCE family protein n=1 Tax=Actinomadura sp. 7K507 TaxID=2530365 RepID=UPI001043EC2E|nr:MCE family protein [Actinomadura sp. 7K507]TDC97931.1 MCE family protein [Actinomadura sp. 7K507]
MSRPPRVLLAVALAAALATAMGGCAVLPGGAGVYRITVYFAKAPSLYEDSRVKVMGANVGTIEDVRTEGRQVRATLRISNKVPIPRDARATIVASNIIGERGIALSPPWKRGMPRAPSGMVIPQERTDLPVEIDEALTVLTELTRSIDPEGLRGALEGGAGAVDGHGGDVNRALGTTGDLVGNLAAQDRELVALARNLNEMATSLNRRDEKLTALIGDISAAGRTLSGERAELKAFLSGLEGLIRRGGAVVSAYREKLPATLSETSELVMTLKANSASIANAIRGLAQVSDMLIETWEPENRTITLRAQVNANLRIWLQPLFEAMGWGEVPCLDQRGDGCTIRREGGS